MNSRHQIRMSLSFIFYLIWLCFFNLITIFYLLIVSRFPFYRGMFQKLAFPFSAIFRKELMHQPQEECRNGFQICRQIEIFSHVIVTPEVKRVQKSTVYLMKNVNKKYHKTQISFHMHFEWLCFYDNHVFIKKNPSFLIETGF